MSELARPKILMLLLALSVALGLMQIAWLYRLHQQNAWIAQLSGGQDIRLDQLTSAGPEVRLARAYYLKQKHRYDEALTTISGIMQQGDGHFQSRLRYLLGNIYLEQAVQKTEQTAYNEALPLAVLAKQAYRQALHYDSAFWDAKYNLEVALRLLPEMDKINSGDEPLNNQKAPLWTTVPGFPRGLP